MIILPVRCLLRMKGPGCFDSLRATAGEYPVFRLRIYILLMVILMGFVSIFLNLMVEKFLLNPLIWVLVFLLMDQLMIV